MKKLVCILTAMTTASLSGNVGEFRELKDGIGIVATACNPTEMLVNAEGWKFTASDFLKKGYRPVRVRLENKSDKVISMSENSVQYTGAEMKQLVERFKVRQNLRPLAWLVVGSSFFGTTGVVSILLAWLMHKQNPRSGGTPAALGVLGGGTSFIGGLYVLFSTPFYRWKLCAANERLYTVVSQALHVGPVIVPQGGFAEKVFLIPEEYQGTFAFSVFNEGDSGVLTKFYINCA